MTRGAARPPAVLLVDDDLDHLIIVRRVLARLAPGLPVTTVADPRAAMPRVRKAPRGALLLVDRRLGDEDGLALVSEACRARPDLRVAVLSASLTRAQERRALACGACVAAEKPAGLDGWRRLLARLLAVPSELRQAA